MRLMSHDWAELKNVYLRSLGEKITGVRWITELTRELWDTACDIWNFRNHILHASDGPKKRKS